MKPTHDILSLTQSRMNKGLHYQLSQIVTNVGSIRPLKINILFG